jgi:HK97 family phage prohead protease
MKEFYSGGREFKFASDGDAMSFSGYGAHFGNVDSYGDVIAPGAFSETLRAVKSTGQWPVMLFNHGFDRSGDTPVGIWTDAHEDEKGLFVTGKLANNDDGQRLHALLKMEPRPAIDGLSIGYIAKEAVPRSKPEEPRRTLKRIDLIEVSLVTFPANGKARVTGVKSASDYTERELERLLCGTLAFSRSEARAFIKGGANALKAMRDAGDENAELVGELRRLLSKLER